MPRDPALAARSAYRPHGWLAGVWLAVALGASILAALLSAPAAAAPAESSRTVTCSASRVLAIGASMEVSDSRAAASPSQAVHAATDEAGECESEPVLRGAPHWPHASWPATSHDPPMPASAPAGTAACQHPHGQAPPLS